MATSSESAPVFSTCSHCEREIPALNIDLHYVYCSRNLQKCAFCGDMIMKKSMDEHYAESHAPVTCSHCGESVERKEWSLHKGENCPQRIVTCTYCDFPSPAIDIVKHQEICGNRTEYCHSCGKYVRLRELAGHDRQCHRTPNAMIEPSRARSIPEQGDRAVLQHPPGSRGFPHMPLFVAIVILGFALLLRSFVGQGKFDATPLQ